MKMLFQISGTNNTLSGCSLTRSSLAVLLLISAAQQVAAAEVVAWDMVDSTNQNLLSHTNTFDGAFASAADGFQKYQRGVSPTIPFSVLDDSVTIRPGDSLGIITESNTHEFFGVTDTQNPQNSGNVTATWVFDIAAGSDLALSIDMGAMGDFESADTFEWTYSIDGGTTVIAFTNLVDDSGSQNYTMAGGATFTLNDPMLVNGSLLSNQMATFSTLISGTGSQLTLTLTAQTNGGSEAFAFQNIKVLTGGLPPDGLAFDMASGSSKRLTSFTNTFAGAFSSLGDGFQKYQRGVSASIPFSLADDSLSIFRADRLGIVKEGNTDEFFGVVDTINGQNPAGPVTATWVFDVSGGTDIGVSIDMAAMGDFEATDTFDWTYSIDGGPVRTAFASSVNEDGSFTYTLEGGLNVTLNDPILMQGEVLTNNLTSFSTPIAGAGSNLALTLTATLNGGSEAVVFQNIIIGEGFEIEPTPLLGIHEIQGTGSSSPFNGDLVETNNNLVTALAVDGFFMQTQDWVGDGNIDTSEGIFVFTGSAPTVLLGDQINVIAEVREFFGFTELTGNPEITVVSSANSLPEPVVFDASVPSSDPTAASCLIEFECYEGMLIQIINGTVGGSNQRFRSDTLAEVLITAASERPFREPGVEFPGLGLPPIATWDGNPEIFELDPNKLGLPNMAIPAGSHFDATGVLGFEFGGYEIWPTELVVREAVIPQGVRARQRAEFTIGSLNMFRLFDDINDPGDMTSQGDTRNDFVVSTAAYAIRRGKLVDYILTVLDAPDILAVQEVEKLGVLEALAADISAFNPDVVYSAYLEEGNDIGTIDVGFLVRNTVAVDAITQLGKDEILAFDGRLLNDRPPLLLEGRVVNDGADFPIAVISVHNRSLGGIETSERVREKRLAQAQSLAAKIQVMQTDNPDLRLVVVGDFNAFEFSDGFVDVVGQIAGNFDPAANLVSGPDEVDPDLLNQVLSISEDERYSFVFRGSAQVLDHALTSMALDASLRGFAYGRGNADAAVDLINDASTSLRASDHDGLVLFLTTDNDDDGVNDDADMCPGTVIPEHPTRGLRKKHFALTDDDFIFDTVIDDKGKSGKSSKSSKSSKSKKHDDENRQFTTLDTAGCSCAQIIEARDLGKGQMKHGCSIGVMKEWVKHIEKQ